MQIRKITIDNFRGIQHADVLLDGHTVFIGDNNAGKSTVLEAVDLVLGPERLSRTPVIDEHDFYNGKYLDDEGNPIPIDIEIIIGALSDEQRRNFNNNLEFWDVKNKTLIETGPPETVDQEHVEEVIRVVFNGSYDKHEDDFVGQTYFWSPDSENKVKFAKSDKKYCGFLYLRALRTGNRALSLERGSLLDIILRIADLRPQMWENILDQLRNTDVKSGKDDEVNVILSNVQDALRKFVPTDWGSSPHLKVSNLTREHLRKTLTVFMSTGDGDYFVPFNHQGTGTINTMVLALLSMIAELKQSVIFAMEEPEIAIPPYTQKRIINSIRGTAAQAIFTSHSPFVLEEFEPHHINLISRKKGIMESFPIILPSMIKPKTYSTEFRTRFSEALLAKRILIAEGSTEASCYPTTARWLAKLAPESYQSFEALGFAIFDARSESNISIFGDFFRSLGKHTYAVFDKQSDAGNLAKIKSSIDFWFESNYKGFEKLILTEVEKPLLIKYVQGKVDAKEWPTHIKLLPKIEEMTPDDFDKALGEYLTRQKASGSADEIIGMCNLSQIPTTLKTQIETIIKHIQLGHEDL